MCVSMRRILATMGTVVLSLLSCELQAQSGISIAAETAEIFGSGQRPSVDYAGEKPPTNVFFAETGYYAAYDSNPAGLSMGAQADLVQDTTGHFVLLHNGPRLDALIEYLPYYEAYQHYSEWNRFNQLFSADVELKATEHWSFRIRDDFTDQTGLYTPQTGESAVSGVGSPTSLNNTVLAPLSNERGNSIRADATYQWSERTSLAAFVGYETRTFSGQIPGTLLYDTNGESGGGQYAWRASEHTTLGVLYLFQRVDISGQLQPGDATRMDVQSALPTVGWKPRPSVDLEFFGGPQAVKQYGAGPAPLSQVEWAGGGTLTLQGQRSAVLFTAQRLVSDGGGLLSFVSNSYAAVSVRRRLLGQWDGTLGLSVAQNQSLGIADGSSNLNAQTASFDLERRLRRNLVFEAGYAYARQTSSGTAPAGADFHRNRVISGLSWQWGTIPLGH
jgi:hypothetical protein